VNPGSNVAIMALTTSFTDMVGCQVPIQLAPMGPVSTPELAVAVADAGGVGCVTAQWLSAIEVDEMLARMAAQTTGIVSANFVTEDIDPEAVEAAAARVPMVDFFWADPDPELVGIAHHNGALACWQVGSVHEARAAAEAGCDVIAVQGIEAGGHIRGRDSLLPLLDSVIGQFDLPVLAAGGIGSGRSFADVLDNGAAGARVGTRFVATEESGAHTAYKQAVVDAAAGSTEITGAFSVCPLCATVPRARVVRSCIDALHHLPSDTVGEATVGGERVRLPKGHGLPPGSAATGHIEAMPMYAGESAAAVEAIEPVATVMTSWCAAAEGRAGLSAETSRAPWLPRTRSANSHAHTQGDWNEPRL
jgi:nitronate monooxygenase